MFMSVEQGIDFLLGKKKITLTIKLIMLSPKTEDSKGGREE